MNYLPSIIKALQFIEKELKNPISLKNIADHVRYSLFHFCRIFNDATGHPPYDYLMRRRLSEAGIELLETQRKTIEVAFDYQFQSPEAFSRAFTRLFGISPRGWRQSGYLNSLSIFHPITENYLHTYNHGQNFKTRQIAAADYDLIGVMWPVSENDPNYRAVWTVLKSELERLEMYNEDKKGLGIVFYQNTGGQSENLYFAGIKRKKSVSKANILVYKKLLNLQLVQISSVKEFENIQYLQKFAWQTWLPRSGLNSTKDFEIHIIERMADIFSGRFEPHVGLPIE